MRSKMKKNLSESTTFVGLVVICNLRPNKPVNRHQHLLIDINGYTLGDTIDFLRDKRTA